MSVPRQDRPEVTRTRALVVVVACLTVVGALGIGVHSDFDPQLRLDGAVSESVYVGDDRAVPLDWLLEALTTPGGSAFRLIVFLAVLAWLLRRRQWPVAAWVFTAVVLIGPLTSLLKAVFGRIRPDFEAGGARLETLSFPSGHSSGIATLVTVALVLAWPVLAPRVRRRWLVVGVAAVVLVGFTRLLLGVHYLSDVLGGWALGLAWALGVALVFRALPGDRRALRARDVRPAVGERSG